MSKKKRKKSGGGAFGKSPAQWGRNLRGENDYSLGLTEAPKKAQWEDIPVGKMREVLETLASDYKEGFLMRHGDDFAWVCFPAHEPMATMYSVNMDGEIAIHRIPQKPNGELIGAI